MQKYIKFLLVSLFVVLVMCSPVYSGYYSKHIQGDAGGFPEGIPNVSDIGLISAMVSVGSSIPVNPGMDAGGFPPNTFSMADLIIWSNVLKLIIGGTPTLPPRELNVDYPFAEITFFGEDSIEFTEPWEHLITIGFQLKSGDKSKFHSWIYSSRGPFEIVVTLSPDTCYSGSSVHACSYITGGACIIMGITGSQYTNISGNAIATLFARINVGVDTPCTVTLSTPACSYKDYTEAIGTPSQRYESCIATNYEVSHTYYGHYTHRCGDGYIWSDGGEECDDWNTINGDRCDEFCQIECSDDCYNPGVLYCASPTSIRICEENNDADACYDWSIEEYPCLYGGTCSNGVCY